LSLLVISATAWQLDEQAVSTSSKSFEIVRFLSWNPGEFTVKVELADVPPTVPPESPYTITTCVASVFAP
jgi:hypothetical protein